MCQAVNSRSDIKQSTQVILLLALHRFGASVCPITSIYEHQQDSHSAKSLCNTTYEVFMSQLGRALSL